jgi:hypothetical protein
MPIPFIIGGIALAAGAYGAKKGYDAYEDYDMANYYNEKAERIYDDAKEELEEARKDTQDSLESLGELKLELYASSILPFIETYNKIKNMPKEALTYKEGKEISEIKKLNFKNIELELKKIVGGGVASLGSGGLVGLASYGGVGMLGTTAGGTAISGLSGAAATNATLAWLGGGSLASGGFGMAGGMAVLGGIVAGPVLAVGGMMIASKAEEARNNARSNLRQAELAEEEMKTAVVKTKAIQRRVSELSEVTVKINEIFVPFLNALNSLVVKEDNWNEYSEIEKVLVTKTGTVWRTLFNLLEVNILTEKGELTENSKKIIEDSRNFLKE